MGKKSSGNKPIKVKTTDKASDAVKQLFEDKRIATQDEFEEKSKKDVGVSAGYVASRKTDNHTFMLKRGMKNLDNVPRNWEIMEAESSARSDMVNEYVMGPLYRRILYDRAPVVELVLESGEQHSQEGLEVMQHSLDGENVYIRSKFLDSFQMLGHYTGNADPVGYYLNTDEAAVNNVKKLEGFEKVIAACLFMGEYDYHAGNIGVVKSVDEQGEEHFTAVKIDHGRSYARYNSGHAMCEVLYSSYKKFGYDALIPLNTHEMLNSINNMLVVQDGEIEQIVSSRVRDMKKAGLQFIHLKEVKVVSKEWGDQVIDEVSKRLKDTNIDGISKGLKDKIIDEVSKKLKENSIDGVTREYRDKIIYEICNEFKEKIIEGASKELKDQIIDDIYKGLKDKIMDGISEEFEYMTIARIKSNKKALRDFGKTLEIIIASDLSQEQKDDLMKTLNATEGEDIVLWMVENNNKIDGIDPISWAAKNDKQIDNKDPVAWAIENQKQIEGKAAIKWAIENQKQIDDKDPVAWAIENRKRIDNRDPIIWAIRNYNRIDNKDPVAWAIENGKRIDNIDPIIWATQNAHEIDNQEPIKWAIENQKQIDNKDPIKWATQNAQEIDNQEPIKWAIGNDKKIEGQDPIQWAIDNKKQIEGKPAAEWVVDDLLKQYIVAKENNDTSKMAELESRHKSIILGDKEEINDVNSDLGQMLASGKNYKTIARVIERVDVKMSKVYESSNALEAVDLKCSSSLEFLYHASKVGEELLRRENVRGKSVLSHALQSFCDLISNIFGKKIPTEIMSEVKKDLDLFAKESKEKKFSEVVAKPIQSGHERF